MIVGVKESRSQGFQGNAWKLLRAESLRKILSTTFGGISAMYKFHLGPAALYDMQEILESEYSGNRNP